MSNALVAIIPARGGSKGIPRKNLRPLCGKPLISYSIQAALNSTSIDTVVVTTDDDEIALFAERFGALVVKRPSELADDEIPLDPVIADAFTRIEESTGKQFNVCVTIQPTSPLIGPSDIDQAVKKYFEVDADTVISATEDRHLRWTIVDGVTQADFAKRVNRQYLPQTYRENGAFVICGRKQVLTGSRIGKRIALYPMCKEASIDVDSYEDLWLCEALLKRRRVVFTVIGDQSHGMGHAYRAVMLAHELVNHEVVFCCPESHTLARNHVASHNYSITTIPDKDFPEGVVDLNPSLVINDILDTSADYIVKLKKRDLKVVNFEDMGTGAEVADLVVNALYPHYLPSDHILVGSKYFCLRDEFLHGPVRADTADVKRILITFGGVDEGNLTCRVVTALAKCIPPGQCEIDIVTGPGYIHNKELEEVLTSIDRTDFALVGVTNRISEYMAKADMAVTSAGRTVLELASMSVPSVVIAQNDRETTHTVISSANGFIFLGHRKSLSDQRLREAIMKVRGDSMLRETMRKRMAQLGVKKGKLRTINRILNLLEHQE